MTVHEYVSTFITNAVCHIQDHINDLTQLCVEIDLDRSHGYNPVYYMVIIVEILVLLCEAKAENMNKGTAQVLVQMHSAIEEQLNKRKRGQIKHAMFRIVTTGKLWRFVLQIQATTFGDDKDGGHSSKHQHINQDQESDT
ncbi:hypothetical protein Glove_441g100 [Diversispora epigaea]|uniref:Uncharacterized protein n=1 Tax=Diversispora epigaea TaxID=1348612 RepID=A0A397GSC4_9GLOM|nr:hypothetical protein Glove_441g100 [Diversispora epigaea]